MTCSKDKLTEEMHSKYCEGFTLQVISELYKIPCTTVHRWFKKRGMITRRVGAPVRYEVSEARMLLLNGKTYRQVASLLGVDHSRLYKRVNHKRENKQKSKRDC